VQARRTQDSAKALDKQSYRKSGQVLIDTGIGLASREDR